MLRIIKLANCGVDIWICIFMTASSLPIAPHWSDMNTSLRGTGGRVCQEGWSVLGRRSWGSEQTSSWAHYPVWLSHFHLCHLSLTSTEQGFFITCARVNSFPPVPLAFWSEAGDVSLVSPKSITQPRSYEITHCPSTQQCPTMVPCEDPTVTLTWFKCQFQNILHVLS